MDEQNYPNNQDNQYTQQDTPAEIPPAYVPPETPPVVPPQPLTPPSIDMPASSHASRKKPVLIIVCAIVAVLLAIGLPLLYMLYGKSTPKNQAATSQQPPKADTTATFSQPDQLIYYSGNGFGTPQTIFAHSIASGKDVKAMTLPQKTNIGYTAIHGGQVAFTVSPGSGSSDPASIYYSTDSGKTYKKIYIVPSSPSTLSGTQITSLIFSADGKTLAAGILLAQDIKTGEKVTGISYKNQVAEISLEANYPTKILFTSDIPGVALKGYDRSKQQIIYLASDCYNCEPTYADIYSYDLKANARDTLYHSKDLSTNVAVNNDFTKALVLEAKPDANERGSVTVPHTLLTVDLSTKAQQVVKTFDSSEPIREAGYTPEGNPYVASNTSIQELADGKTNTLFELSRGNDAFDFPWVLFAGAQGAIGNVTASTKNDNRGAAVFSIMYAKPGTTTPTEIMKVGNLNGDVTPMGITRK